MIFGIYLKLCREKYNLTQEELVHKCYNYHEDFEGLDVGTLSRWERGITNPSVDKQIKLTKILRKYDNHIFPYINTYSRDEVEHELSVKSINSLIGNSKEHILKFPHSDLITQNLKITNVKETNNIETILKMPNDVLTTLLNNHYNLNIETLSSWVKHKNNLFLVSEYKDNFFGMIFVLRVKPTVFENLLSYKCDLASLSDSDFAQDSEIGCSFPVTFFAYNQTTAALLYLQYYANLIANQDYISDVGITPILDSSIKLAEKIGLVKYKTVKTDRGENSSYKASLEDVLLREDVFKMLFKK